MTLPLRTRLSSAALLAIGGLHAVWAGGSSWPTRGDDALAEAAGGGRSHTPSECLAVTGLLTTASAVVAGRPRRAPRLQRAAAAAVVGVLAARGTFGLAGRTDLLSPGATSARFRALDRRYYSPLCLALAATALPATRRFS